MLRFSEDVPHLLDSAFRHGYGDGEGSETRKLVTVSHEDDEKTQLLSQGLSLLLAARERVLTLSEQHVGLFSLSTYHYLFVFVLAPSPSDPSTHVTLCNHLC
jgi:hypothetical protein